MKEIEFKRYNEQSCIWYYKFKPSMEAFPLSVDHNKYTSIGLAEHKEVPTYAQVNYMVFLRFFRHKCFVIEIQKLSLKLAILSNVMAGN